MFKNIVPVVLLSGLSLTAGIAYSTEVAFPSNPEHSFSSQPAPSPLTRAEVRGEAEAFRLSPVSPDGWRYVGGERDLERIQHGYSYSGGKLVHSDLFVHNAPKTDKRLTEYEKILAQVQYKTGS